MMRSLLTLHRLGVGGVVLAAVGVLVFGAAYSYARSQDDVIARGVHAGAIDLGDLSADAARARLERAYRPLAPPPSPAGDCAGAAPPLFLVHHDRPGRFPAPRLQAPEARAQLPDRRRPARAADAGRYLPHPEQGSEPVLAGAVQFVDRLARWPVDSARPRRPAQGALARDLQRRRYPRDRRDVVDRPCRLARLRADDDPGRDRPLRPGQRRNPG